MLNNNTTNTGTVGGNMKMLITLIGTRTLGVFHRGLYNNYLDTNNTIILQYFRFCQHLDDHHISLLAQKSLTFLDIGYCNLISDASLLTIAQNCQKLVTLKLGCCSQLTDAGIIKIAERCKLLR
jgi:hypothetical protein